MASSMFPEDPLQDLLTSLGAYGNSGNMSFLPQNNDYGFGNILSPDLSSMMQYRSPVPITPSMPSTVMPGNTRGFWQGLGDWARSSGMLGYTDEKTGKTYQGWGGYALGGTQALMNAFMGMKQYGLAKKQLAESKRQFNLNYDAQRSTTNAQLEDRQRSRVAANPGAYQSVGDYMKQYGIK